MDNNKFRIITIDGGAASGKSTTAERLSKKLNFLNINSGLYYRTLSYHLLKHKVPLLDVSNRSKLKIKCFLENLQYFTKIKNNCPIIIIDNTIINEKNLRTKKINEYVSSYSAIIEIRSFMLLYQQSLIKIAKEKNYPGIVAEGRDMGTEVYPDADLKIFLYADSQTRVLRRKNDGELDNVVDRDKLDKGRKISPLSCPKNALKINTDLNSQDEVISLILKKI